MDSIPFYGSEEYHKKHVTSFGSSRKMIGFNAVQFSKFEGVDDAQITVLLRGVQHSTKDASQTESWS